MVARPLLCLAQVTACVGATGGSPLPSQRAGTPTANKSAEPTFVCPDKNSEKACQSFLELWRAGDPGVHPRNGSSGDIAYVCFRHPEDQFFVFSMRGPILSKQQLDAAAKTHFVDDTEGSFAFGFISGFKNGVGDTSITPIQMMRGTWKPTGIGPVFSATQLNARGELPHDSGLIIDPSQISGSLRFQNQVNKDVDYVLVIQRSTGRFSETYRYAEASSNVPFSEESGRCTKLPAK